MMGVEDAVRRGLLGNRLLDHLRLRRRRLCLQRRRHGVSGLRRVVGEFWRRGQASADRGMSVGFLGLASDVIGTHVALGQQLAGLCRAIRARRRLLGDLRESRRGVNARWRNLRLSLRTPLRARGTIDTGGLIGLGMDVLRRRRR